MTSHGGGGGAPRVPFIGGLDGIRALAVTAVLLYHADLWWIPGGFLGVEVFFVLSGYLITALLWSEMRTSGGIDLRAFWRRRARRLLPAVFGLLIAVAAAFVAGWPSEVARIRGDIAAAFGYVSNWYLIGTDQSYFESFARPSPLRHLWSLAIEEQFYVLWPVALYGLVRILRRPARVAAAVAVVAGASAVAMGMLFSTADPSRAYYGTDSRATGLLLGAALALVWRPFEQRDRKRIDPRVLDACTIGSIAFLVWAFLRFDEFAATTYRPGIQAVGLATGLLIASCVHPAARVGRALGLAPLGWLGRRSYGIYLWHWPVFVLTRPGIDLHGNEAAILALRIAVTLALAEASYRLIEQPFRSGAVGRVTSGILARIVLSPVIKRRAVIGWTAIFTAMMIGFASLAAAVVRAPTPAPVTLASAGAQNIEDPPLFIPSRPSSVRARIGAATPETGTRRTTARPGLPRRTPAVIAIGDSVMLGARATLRARIDGVYVDAVLNRSFDGGIKLLRRIKAAGRLGRAVVIHLGNNGIISTERFDEMMRVLQDVDVVAFINVRVPRRWERPVNRVIEAGVARYRQAVLVDWHDRWKGCAGWVFASDGVHLTKPGAACYTSMINSVV